MMKRNVSGAAVLAMVCGMAMAGGAMAQSLEGMKKEAQRIADEAKKSAQAAGDKAAQDAKGAVKAAMGDTSIDLNAPLPTDPRLVKGELPNGLKYIVLKHSNPPGRAAMYIHVSTGSLNEQDHQRGIAHYLEHMAFNGSKNFPPNTVIDFFQSMGLTFGQHQNAFTSFDQTTYILAFPDTKPETIAKGMEFFSDVAMNLLLDQKEIDEERGIIQEEKRTRAGGQQRMQDYILSNIAPGSLIGARLPIGTDETLAKVMRPDFEEYYTKYYTPSNMTVMVVADAPEQEMVQAITKAFSSGEKRPVPQDQDPKIAATQGVRGVVATDKEQTTAEISMMKISAKQEPTTTVGAMRKDLVEQIGSSAFNRRIGAKIAKGGTTYTQASGSSSNMFNAAHMATVGAEGKPETWRQMVGEIATDLQRARLHGFTAREIEDVKTQIMSGAEQMVKQEATMPARAVIGGLNNSVASGDTPMGAQQELDLLKKVLPTITAEEVSKKFAEVYDMTNVVFVGQFPEAMPDGTKPPTEPELADLGKKALDVKPEAESEADRPTELMAQKPKAGAITSQSAHEATKVKTGVLDNGVTFHYRFMDYRKDDVTVSVNLAAGAIQETGANRGTAEVAGLAWAFPATTTLTSTNVRDLMTGKKVRVRGGAGMDTMTLSVSGSPTDLETGMQLAHLMLTDPVIEQSRFDQWKTRQLQEIEERQKVIEGVFVTSLAEMIYPESESRPKPLTAEQVNKLSVEAGQNFLRNAIRTAPIEVSIVGDISEEKAMDLLKTYIGSLGKRDAIGKGTLDDLRTIAKPKGPRLKEKTVDTQTDKAYVAVGFYGPDMENVIDRRNMQVATRIISTRMIKKIREQEQLAYSPSAGLRPGMEFPGFGTIAMATQTKPSKAPRLVEAANEIYADFAKNGPTEEEMTTARKQIANTLDEQYKEPSFWLQQTATMSYRDMKLDDVVSAPAYYETLKGEDVKATFAKYYTPEAQMALIVKPSKSTETEETGTKPGEPK